MKGGRKQQNHRNKECKLLTRHSALLASFSFLSIPYRNGVNRYVELFPSSVRALPTVGLNHCSSPRTIIMSRPHVPSNRPRPARPSTIKPADASSHVKEKTTSTRKRGATDDLSNPHKKSSKTKKTDYRPVPDFSDDPPYDQVEGTIHHLIARWNQLKAENQKLEQKYLLRESKETELKEQVKKLTLIQRAAYVYTFLCRHNRCIHFVTGKTTTTLAATM